MCIRVTIALYIMGEDYVVKLKNYSLKNSDVS